MINNPRSVARKPASPCYKCADRFAGCHSICELYADYKGKIEAEKAAMQEVYAPVWDATNYVIKAKRKAATTKRARDKNGHQF